MQSYVAVSRKTGLGVWEFYNPSLVKKINRKLYAVMTFYNYIRQLNKSILQGT